MKRQEKQRLGTTFDWDPYDPTYKKYLHIGLKTRMKDQFRSRRVALWLNLIPDLVRSGQMENREESKLMEEEYLTYRETLPLIPSIKDISLSKSKLQAKSYGVMMGDHSALPSERELLRHGRRKSLLLLHRSECDHRNRNFSPDPQHPHLRSCLLPERQEQDGL